MAVHDDVVVGIDLETGDMAHQVGRQLAGELAAVGIAPEELGILAVSGDTEQAKVARGIILHVLEILAGAGHEEVHTGEARSGKARRDHAQHLVDVDILGNVLFVETQADVAAVALIPAVGVHIGCGADHFHQERGSQNVFHVFFLQIIVRIFLLFTA